jgi:hypothetical protein
VSAAPGKPGVSSGQHRSTGPCKRRPGRSAAASAVDRREKHEKQQRKKKIAGEKSGLVRAARVKIRRYFVRAAFERLKPAHQKNPFADESITALEAEFRKSPTKGDYSLDPSMSYDFEPPEAAFETINWGAPRRKSSAELEDAFDAMMDTLNRFGFDLLVSAVSGKESRDTLKKDMIALGIRSKR